LMDPHLEQLFIEREQLIDSILSVQEQVRIDFCVVVALPVHFYSWY
jgi:hypothetical protein